jgi:hypothetical protein
MWSSFTASVLNSLPSNSDISFSDVETRLLAEAQRITAVSAKSNAMLKTAMSKPKHCACHGKCAHSTSECDTPKAECKKKKTQKVKWKDEAHHAEDMTGKSTEDSAPEDVAQVNHVVTSKKLMKHIVAYTAIPSNLKKSAFILDSGCSTHMYPQCGYFVSQEHSNHTDSKCHPPLKRSDTEMYIYTALSRETISKSPLPTASTSPHSPSP